MVHARCASSLSSGTGVGPQYPTSEVPAQCTDSPHGQKRKLSPADEIPVTSPTPPASTTQTSAPSTPVIMLVDDEEEMPKDLRELLERSKKLQGFIAELERIAHFNDRGEYNLPCLPGLKKAVATSSSWRNGPPATG